MSDKIDDLKDLVNRLITEIAVMDTKMTRKVESIDLMTEMSALEKSMTKSVDKKIEEKTGINWWHFLIYAMGGGGAGMLGG